MELAEAIYGRRATRAFASQPVAKAVLERLVDAAIQAPTAVNQQPWDFAIVRGQARLKQIAQTAKQHMSNIIESELQHHFRSDLGDPDFDIFYHAPVLIVISAKVGEWAIEDASLAAENLMLTAHALGLGSCWIGFAQRWLETDEGRSSIRLPSNFLPVAPIILGYPAKQMPAVPRKPPVVRWINGDQ
ncbi:nitroreductase family protein [Rhizobium leucaenae]|uniref:nitroreductase family protein n=1 Tax=Rhizobium leucaenae TaxID=29450 RepID=UPI0007EE4781|nr:nitroreductase [Rhizobium leucaenae]MBB6305194.1 nitroreductase [Rhizobium leucaenae]